MISRAYGTNMTPRNLWKHALINKISGYARNKQTHEITSKIQLFGPQILCKTIHGKRMLG
jgi:hypothetical protein